MESGLEKAIVYKYATSRDRKESDGVIEMVKVANEANEDVTARGFAICSCILELWAFCYWSAKQQHSLSRALVGQASAGEWTT